MTIVYLPTTLSVNLTYLRSPLLQEQPILYQGSHISPYHQSANYSTLDAKPFLEQNRSPLLTKMMTSFFKEPVTLAQDSGASH